MASTQTATVPLDETNRNRSRDDGPRFAEGLLWLPALAVAPNVLFGSMPWPIAVLASPDPRHVAATASSGAVAKGISKFFRSELVARRVESCADHFAARLREQRTTEFRSFPTLDFWSPQEVKMDEATGEAGVSLLGELTPLAMLTGFAVLHELWRDPGSYRLSRDQMHEVAVPFQLYSGLDESRALQVLHDRNYCAVPLSESEMPSKPERLPRPAAATDEREHKPLRGGATRKHSVPLPASRQAIRFWANENGYVVAKAGALSKAVVEAYRAAHQR